MAVYDALEACRRRAALVRSVVPERTHRLHRRHRRAFREHRVGAAAAPAQFGHGGQPARYFIPATDRRAGRATEPLRRPTVVSTYPTVAVLLAEEADAGRLRIAPSEVWTGGETLTAGMRGRIERQFGCTVINNYGASEFLPLASQCRCGMLHLNSDWAILEPVDEQIATVPAGCAQPHGVADQSRESPPADHPLRPGRPRAGAPQRCECGSPLPVIDVQGRCDDMLVLAPRDGEPCVCCRWH